MSLSYLRYLLYADLFRYGDRAHLASFLRHLLATPGFQYTVFMRACQYLATRKPRPLFLPLYLAMRLVARELGFKYGIAIPASTNVGPGLFIGHPGDIVVHPRSVIGRNCNISQGVTLGQANRGKRQGYPTVGDNVYIGPGAKLVGAVRVGNNVAIGANCVVTRDVPDNAVVVGIPGKVLSYDGAEHYVSNTNYRPYVEHRPARLSTPRTGNEPARQ
jgi:serine O-acetyltransferase